MPQWNWKQRISLKGRWRKWEEEKENKKGKEHERQIAHQEHGTKHPNNKYRPCNVTETFGEPRGMSSPPECRASYSPGGALLPGTPSEIDIVVPQPSSPAEQFFYPGSTFHQNPSQLQLVAGPINIPPYGASCVPGPPTCNFDLASNACAALDLLPSLIPFVHPESNVEPTFAAHEQLNSPSVARVSCGCTNHHQFGQGEMEDKHDSGCYFSSCDSAIGNNLESQDNGGQLPNETCTKFPAYDEVTARTTLGFSGETLKDEVKNIEKGPRGLSENGLRQSTARGKNVKQDLRPSESSPVPETSNANAQEDVEGPKNSEVPIMEQSSAIVSQPGNQVALSSSWRSEAAMTQYSQRDFRESLGLEGLPDHVVQQLEHNHKQNVRFVQRAREARSLENLKSKRSVGTFGPTGENMESTHELERRQLGYHRQPVHHASRSSLTFESQNIGPGRPASPFPFRGGVRHNISTQSQSSARVHPVGINVSFEAQSTQSSVSGISDINSKRKFETPVDARSNTRANNLAVRAHNDNPNHQLRIPSASSGYNFAPGPQATNPPLHYLRNRGGPFDPRLDSHASRSVIGGHSPPEDSYFRPSLAMYPTTTPEPRNLMEHMSEVEFSHDISSPWPVPITPTNNPHRSPPWAQSPQDYPMPRPLRRNSVKGAYRPFMHSASTNASVQLNHRRSMGYLPPSGPPNTDIRPLNLPKRGMTRSPKNVPMVPCAPANPNTSCDKSNERTGLHYSNNNLENVSAPKYAIGEENREMLRRGPNWKPTPSARIMERVERFEKGEAQRIAKDSTTIETETDGKGKTPTHSTPTTPAPSPAPQHSTEEERSSTPTPPHPEQPIVTEPPSPAADWNEMRRRWRTMRMNAERLKYGVALVEEDEGDEEAMMSGALP